VDIKELILCRRDAYLGARLHEGAGRRLTRLGRWDPHGERAHSVRALMGRRA
jgi:hypothetical protein